MFTSYLCYHSRLVFIHIHDKLQHSNTLVKRFEFKVVSVMFEPEERNNNCKTPDAFQKININAIDLSASCWGSMFFIVGKH